MEEEVSARMDTLQQVESNYSWMLAVCLAIVSVFLTNIGTNLQKLAWRFSVEQTYKETHLEKAILEKDMGYLNNDEQTTQKLVEKKRRRRRRDTGIGIDTETAEVKARYREEETGEEEAEEEFDDAKSYVSFSGVSAFSMQSASRKHRSQRHGNYKHGKLFMASPMQRQPSVPHNRNGSAVNRRQTRFSSFSNVSNGTGATASDRDIDTDFPSQHTGREETQKLRSGEGASGGERSYAQSLTYFRLSWWSGLSFMIVGAMFDFAALGFGAQSIVAPLGALTLVVNLGLAKLIHKEQPTLFDVLATMMILFGCILAVIFAPKQTEFTSVDYLLHRYTQPTFALYAMVILGIIAFFVISLHQTERSLELGETDALEYARLQRFHRFGYPTLGGVIGAQSVLFAKSLDELLISTIADVDSYGAFYNHIQTILLLVAMVVCIFGQIYYVNMGLRKWDALYVVPIFQSNWIVFSVIGGGVFYEEFAHFSLLQCISFVSGVSITVLGVYVLSLRKPKPRQDLYEPLLKPSRNNDR